MLTCQSWVRLFWLGVLIVLLLLLMPLAENPNPGIRHLDKWVHAIIFMGLAWLALRAWPAWSWRILFGLLVLAGLTEVLQGLTGWRTASLADFYADGVGIGLVLIVRHVKKVLVPT